MSAQAAAQVAAAQSRTESNNNGGGSGAKKPRLNNNIDVEEDQESGGMKVPPITLNGGPPVANGGPPLPFSPEFLWRYPNPFALQPPPSPLESQIKLPSGLGHDPKCWSRDDVSVFMRHCEREYDLEKIDMEKFQMNGTN